MTNLAYLSLGSNIGDRERHLRDAVARLASVGRVVSVSSFFETEPVEFTEQAWFVNCAVGIETVLRPAQLMAAVLEIEHEMGRQRTMRKGPRTIDIDILLFGDSVISEPELKVPHPGMHRRRFVLEPLSEIAADARHPLLGKTVRELLAELPAGQSVRQFLREE